MEPRDLFGPVPPPTYIEPLPRRVTSHRALFELAGTDITIDVTGKASAIEGRLSRIYTTGAGAEIVAIALERTDRKGGAPASIIPWHAIEEIRPIS